jgi:hypothetical protein
MELWCVHVPGMRAFFLFVLCVFSPSPLPSLMHQLTTGALPFDGASAAEVVNSILYAPIPPLDGIFSLALKKTIAHMLEKVFFCLWGAAFFLLAGTGEEAEGGRSASAGGNAHINPTTRFVRYRECEVDT